MEWKKRSFTEENIEKLDRLLKYLFKNEIEYTFHAGWFYKEKPSASNPTPPRFEIYTVSWVS